MQHYGYVGIIGLGSKIEALNGYKGRIMLDLKHPKLSRNYPENLAKKLNALGLTGISICGPNHKTVSKVCELTGSEAIYTINSLKKVEEYIRNHENLISASGFSIHHQIVDAKLIETLIQFIKSSKPKLWSFTISTIEEAKRQMACGINGLITDDHQALSQAFATSP